MMGTELRPDYLPLSYRNREVSDIMRAIRAGDSCSIVGVSGMAKSNLFRHLLNLEMRQHYLGDGWQTYIFLDADSHALGAHLQRGAPSPASHSSRPEAVQERGALGPPEHVGHVQAVGGEGERGVARGPPPRFDGLRRAPGRIVSISSTRSDT